MPEGIAEPDETLMPSALSELRQPPSVRSGLFAMTPTLRPASLPNPTTMLGAHWTGSPRTWRWSCRDRRRARVSRLFDDGVRHRRGARRFGQQRAQVSVINGGSCARG